MRKDAAAKDRFSAVAILEYMTTRAFTDEEAALLETALLQRGRLRDRLFLVMALGTGFRVSELLSISWHQLLSSTGEIRADLTVERARLKGGAGLRQKSIRSRRVPLSAKVRGAIADYLGSLDAVPQGPVFLSQVGEGRAITREHAHRWLKRLARQLGFDASRLACHSARKSFAVRCHQAAQYDLVKTQRLMGHTSVVTTARYLDTAQDQLDSIVLGLDAPPAKLTCASQTAQGKMG